MAQESITIPQNTLLEILRMQPESVLIQLFDDLFVSSDTEPLSEEEKMDLEEAKKEYFDGQTIAWKK